MHYLLNLTWRCQNRCTYCWMQQTVAKRAEMVTAPEAGESRWVAAIWRDKVNVIDIAGGEPLLVPWLPALMADCPYTHFGLSTNGLAEHGVRMLALRRLPNLGSINLSYHPESAGYIRDYEIRFRSAAQALVGAGYSVQTNIVSAGDNEESSATTAAWLRGVGVHVVVSPYEDTAHLGEKRAEGLCCQGGINHLTVAPDGSAWPCLTTIRSPYWRETCLGNWLNGPVDLSRKPQPCHLDCVDYYVLRTQHEAGDMWQINARPWGSGECVS